MTNLFILSLTICVTLALSGTVPKDSQGNGRCHEDIACEGGVLNLACPAGSVMHIAEANYGRTLPDAQMCPYGKQHNDITSCHATNSKSVVSRACEGQASCSVASKNGVFGDPCGGTYKYLRVQYCCDFPKPNHCVERIACEPLGLKLECPRRSVIHVEAANYGRTLPDAQVCPYGSSHNDVTNCFATSSMSEVTNACEGKSSCDVPSGNGVFGDPCLGTYKYLQVNYCCKVRRKGPI